jgi:lipopolysaccharide export system protein LptA
MNSLSSLLITLALLASFPATAEKADRDKPMNAEADALRYDDLKKSSVFTGNVVISKGSIVIRGGRVEVSQDAKGYQQALVTAAPGKLAFYRSKRDGLDEFIEGEAELIEYDGQADTVKFIRQAVMRRYVGAKLADETSGALIRYDNTTDVFTVDGSLQSPRTAANPGGRVRAVLSPREPASAPAARPPAAAIPTPALRPSNSLGGDKK